jgi:methylated-DNA-protein-cysteine methyltransferase related protein
MQPRLPDTPDGRWAYPPAVDAETAERVREVIRSIPEGSTLSYGEVAAIAGLRSARQVGALLSEDGQDLPWHRVHRADGSFAPHLVVEQTQRLRAEGVDVRDGRVRRDRHPRPAERTRNT